MNAEQKTHCVCENVHCCAFSRDVGTFALQSHFLRPPKKIQRLCTEQVKLERMRVKVKVSTILPAELRIYVDRSDVNKLHKMCMLPAHFLVEKD